MTKRRRLPILPALFASLCLSGSAARLPAGDTDAPTVREAVAAFERLGDMFRFAVETAGPTTVSIESTSVRPVHPARTPGRSVQMQVEETGCGVIADFDGKRVILTNRHVVEGIDLDSIKIQASDRRLLTPTRIRTNADFDLAVVEVAEPLNRAAVFGDSDRVRVGDVVLALGSPFGLEQSVSMGIVSAVNRRRIPSATASTPLCAFFQTDAAVNPGSSGGPLLNLRGEAIGLVTAIATQGGGNEGVAFVIPIRTVLRITRQLVRNDVVVRPYLGVGFDPAFDFKQRRELGLDRMIGARINRVLPDSPASRAGLAVDDVILSLGGVEIEDDAHVVDRVADSEIDKPLALTILRDGKIQPLSVTPTSQISR